MAVLASKTTFTAIVGITNTAIKTTKGRVFWVSIGNAAGAFFMQLNDSIDNSGTDIFQASFAPNRAGFFGPFDPPLEFTNGLYYEVVAGSTAVVTIGYQ